MIVRSSADTIPSVTVGSPSRSRANPMATHLVAEPDVGGRGERDRRQVVGVDAQQGEVVAGVGGQQLGLGRLGLAGQPDADLAWPRRRRGRWSGSRRRPRRRRRCRRPRAALQVGADRHDRRADRLGDGAHREARPGSTLTGQRDGVASAAARLVVVDRQPDQHAADAGHERRRAGGDDERPRPATRPARPARLGGFGGTPGAGGGSTGMRTVYRLDRAPSRRAPVDAARPGRGRAVSRRGSAGPDRRSSASARRRRSSPSPCP